MPQRCEAAAGKGRQCPQPLLPGASLSVGRHLWKQGCFGDKWSCESHTHSVPTPPLGSCLTYGGSWVASAGVRHQCAAVVTGSVVVCRERRASLGSVETKETQENR